MKCLLMLAFSIIVKLSNFSCSQKELAKSQQKFNSTHFLFWGFALWQDKDGDDSEEDDDEQDDDDEDDEEDGDADN